MIIDFGQVRRSYLLALVVAFIIIVDLIFFLGNGEQRDSREKRLQTMRLTVKELGLSDLAIATEARYTRHPAVSDPVVPFMDHPGAIEHFPTGSFWRPVP